MALLLALGLSATAAAQDDSEVMVVLDVSGSMWGQIEGETKIEIARRAFANLALTWREKEIRAGLIAYGHRRKGDCNDIEIVSTPSVESTLSMGEAVNALTPRGKTPLTQAIRQAADVLKFTEDPATVVLLSDGRETCEADPCAVAAELEELGVGFTAHVIGFDVAAPEDVAQLRCIAENTGGRYFDAADAGALDAAFLKVADIQPSPLTETGAPRDISIRPELSDGTVPSGPAHWTLLREGERDIRAPVTEIATGKFGLEPGRYEVSVALDSPLGEIEGTMVLKVDANTTQTVVLPVAYATPDADLALRGPANAGEDIVFDVAVSSTGSEDRIRIVPRGGSDSQEVASATAGPEVAILANFEPGEYDALYVADAYSLREEVARLPFTLAPRQLELIELAPVVAGAEGTLELSGPVRSGDVLYLETGSGERAATIQLQDRRFGVPADLAPMSYKATLNRNYALTLDMGEIYVVPADAAPVGEDAAAPDPQDNTAVDGDGHGPDTAEDGRPWSSYALACPEDGGDCPIKDDETSLSMSLPPGWVATAPSRTPMTAGAQAASVKLRYPYVEFYETNGDLNELVLNPHQWIESNGPCWWTRAGQLCSFKGPSTSTPLFQDAVSTLQKTLSQSPVRQRCAAKQPCSVEMAEGFEVTMPALWSVEVPQTLDDGRPATWFFNLASEPFQLLGLNQEGGEDCQMTARGPLCIHSGEVNANDIALVADTLAVTSPGGRPLSAPQIDALMTRLAATPE